MARQAEESKKKEEAKARFMQDKNLNKVGMMQRLQFKTVKKSVKQNKMSVETGNQIILKHMQECNNKLLKSAKAVAKNKTTRSMLKIIHREYEDLEGQERSISRSPIALTRRTNRTESKS